MSWKQCCLNCKENGITVKVYEPNDALPNINPKNPRVYVSVGDTWNEFPTLSGLPLHERKRWLHFQSLEDIQPDKLFYCWFTLPNLYPKLELSRLIDFLQKLH